MLKQIIHSCIIGLLLALSALAADISGIWTGTLTDGNGDPQNLSFRFSQKSKALTGKMYGDNESTAIAASEIAGDQITFTVTTELNGQISTFVYTAKAEGDHMDVSRMRVEVNASKPAKPQTFQLKRLT